MLKAAASLELVLTIRLIHDDLPAPDDHFRPQATGKVTFLTPLGKEEARRLAVGGAEAARGALRGAGLDVPLLEGLAE